MPGLDDLGERFWAWRARQAPRGRDDIPRPVRPPGWLPEVGAPARDRQREQLVAFERELAAMPEPVAVSDRVDRRLLRSAMSRVRWELDVLRVWTRPRYWVDQTLGVIFDVLLPPGVDGPRVEEVVRLLRAVPDTLAHAEQALAGTGCRPFTRSALAELADIEVRLEDCARALVSVVPSAAGELRAGVGIAATSVARWRSDLEAALPALPADAPAVGRENYEWFLREVACLPFDCSALRALGRAEYDRAAASERIAARAAAGVPLPALPRDARAQCDRQARDEEAVQAYCAARGLLGRSAGVGRYLNAPMPDYLQPLRFLGVTDDLTGPGRLHHDAVSYVPDPAGPLPYFYAANARDPRLGIAHEGTHYHQLARSWAHPRPLRRRYYDSGPNEGIAFYAEEMLLVAGLFDDAPHSRTTVYNMTRLRALRVEVDVALALGEIDLDGAAHLLRTHVPMDAPTAQEEAAFFAESPGQAISYQVGKSQILALVAQASAAAGAAFDLGALHDTLWLNGNVPVALLRWELLGSTDELGAVGMAP